MCLRAMVPIYAEGYVGLTGAMTFSAQSLALAILAFSCFVKYAYMTGSYRRVNELAAQRSPSNFLIFSWAICVFPTVFVLGVATASVFGWPCGIKNLTTITVITILAVLPLGIAKVSALLTGYAAVATGLVLWSHTSGAVCLNVGTTCILTGVLSMMAYGYVTRLWRFAAIAAVAKPTEFFTKIWSQYTRVGPL